nr:glycosyltransferase family 39 protein [Promineifilum sp.]
MNNIYVHQPTPRAHPGRELLRALVRRPAVWAALITLMGFGLRIWALESVPPGWRDDELIETLVISRKILDGNLAFYYPDASGHEALYHALNALFLAFFGPTGPGIRLLSAFLGTLAVPLTYALGRRLFGAAVGLSAAMLLAVSFWGLMYSRVGIRHSLTPVLATAAFYWFWRAMELTNDEVHPSDIIRPAAGNRRPLAFFAVAGLLLGLGFHSYFASRGAPLIPAAFVVYLLLAAPSRLRGKWRGLLLMAGVALVTALPLLLAVAAQPEAEGRVGELALPLIEARDGNFELLVEHAVAALTMPHATGDPEWLYNIPERPIFGVVGALFFWSGVALALWRALRPIGERIGNRGSSGTPGFRPDDGGPAAAFLLIWWLVGISPAVLSVPPASLGHVILPQPAFYL